MFIKFNSEAHKKFYEDMESKCTKWDCYHKALMYALGICNDTRKHIEQIFDFKNNVIIPECVTQGWQTSGSEKVCCLAFNLWNGYSGKNTGNRCCVDDIFCCEYAPFFFEAIKLRYQEYFPDERYAVKDSDNKVYEICTTKFMAESYKLVLSNEYGKDLHIDVAEDIIKEVNVN